MQPTNIKGAKLTPREWEIISLFATGFTNKAIADELGISVKTVSAHCARIYGKLGVLSRTEAVQRAGEIYHHLIDFYDKKGYTLPHDEDEINPRLLFAEAQRSQLTILEQLTRPVRQQEVSKEPLTEFTREVRDACSRVYKRLLEFLGGEKGCIIAVQPSGIFFATVLQEYLREYQLEVDLATTDIEGYGIENVDLKGKRVFIVDHGIVTGRTYRKTTELIKSRGAAHVLYVTWEDSLGLADIVL